MRRIPLSKGLETVVDDEDFALYGYLKWSASDNGYAVRQERGPDGKPTRVYLHRLIAGASANEEVDHDNEDKLCNLRSNLKLKPKARHTSDHGRRQGPRKGRRFKGAYWFKPAGLWTAQIQDGPKCRSLGYYRSEEEAARAYDRAALELFGPGCFLNFPAQSGCSV